MGGAVSSGHNNDELIDNLVDAKYIKSSLVEKVFRGVDRGDYYIHGCKENAYRDLAWKNGHIHLSAPCIYSEVMECLSLAPGLSFLNLGSGTGYLSTMAGLILGAYGTNHGVELHADVVEFAKDKLDEFLQFGPAFDKFEFCAPRFVVGNCLLLDGSVPQYDRVYCGASCPIEYESYMKNLIRIGGILVMPFNDHLLKVTRTGESSYDVKNLIPVSFAHLIVPAPTIKATIKLPEFTPQLLKLQEFCRLSIRAHLRKVAEVDPVVVAVRRDITRREKGGLSSLVLPAYQDDSESEEIDEQSEAEENDRAGTSGNSESSSERVQLTAGPSRIKLDFNVLKPLKHFADVLEANGLEFDLDLGAKCEVRDEPVLENLVDDDKDKGQQGSGDSGIDNVSDDSFPEECSSDVEMADVKCSDPSPSDPPEERPRSSCLKRSAEDDGVDDPNRKCCGKGSHRRNKTSYISPREIFGDDNDELDADVDSDYIPELYVPEPQSIRELTLHSTSMRRRILQLPLPLILRSFLNYSRPFH